MEGELGLVHVPTDHPGHQGNGLGAAVGEKKACGVDPHGIGQRPGGRPSVGITAKGGEMAFEHGHRIRGHGIERHGEIEDGLDLQPERLRHGNGIATVRSHRHRGHGAGSPARRRARTAPAARSIRASATRTSRRSRTARSMSPASGGRPVALAPAAARGARRSECPRRGEHRGRPRTLLRPRRRWVTGGRAPEAERHATHGAPSRGAPPPRARR